MIIEQFGPSVNVDVVRYYHGNFEQVSATAATEVPFTIMVNAMSLPPDVFPIRLAPVLLRTRLSDMSSWSEQTP